MRKIYQMHPWVRCVMLASCWAREIGLPVGNLWEPAVARNIEQAWRALGGDDLAWPVVETRWRQRVGLPSA